MKDFIIVYILVSQANPAIHYTGITRDLARGPPPEFLSARTTLLEHNRDNCANTSQHRPWRIETDVAFKSESKARVFEKYLKSGSGREFARRHF
jgi:putative endonuclease